MKKTDSAMSVQELKAAIVNLGPDIQPKVAPFIEAIRRTKKGKNRPRRPFSKLSAESQALACEIVAKGGSYRLAEEILSLTVRNGMSAYDGVKKLTA